MLGYIALMIIHVSALPTIFGYATLPPIEMNLLLIFGLTLFTFDAFCNKIYFYAYGTLIGLMLQLIILIKILGVL